MTTQAVTRQAASDEDRILGAFKGEVPPMPVSPWYTVGLLAVAVVMILLPLVYLGLIGLGLWLLHYHAVHNVTLLSGRTTKFHMFAYVAPLVVGGVVLLFMFKPLLARRPRQARPRQLSPEENPLLLAFVRRIAEAVGAPVPRSIYADCDVNASASFRHGMLSFFWNDMALTIGLPLVAGMNLRDLASVLAHELGHFSQGTGMRLTYIIRTVNAWFMRVAYRRDSWDEWIYRISQSQENGWLTVVAWLVRLFVWVTRLTLRILLYVGHAVSCFLLRQMEYDADRYSAAVAGSDYFKSTSDKLLLLSLSSNSALNQLQDFWQERRLCSDLPGYIAANVQNIPAKVARDISKCQVTRMFDTHPCDADRIHNVKRMRCEGIFRLDEPARMLFGDFTGLSAHVTFEFYRQALGPTVERENLVDNRLLLGQLGRQDQAIKSQARFFQGLLVTYGLLPVQLPSEGKLVRGGLGVLADEVLNLRNKLLDQAPQGRRLVSQLTESVQQATVAHHVGLLKSVKLPINSMTKFLSRQQLGNIEVTISQAKDSSARCLEALQAGAQSTAMRRLGLDIMLLSHPQVECDIPDAAGLQHEARQLMHAANTTVYAATAVEAAFFEHSGMGVLLACLKENQENQTFINRIKSGAAKVRQSLREIRDQLEGQDYPFEHVGPDLTLADYAVGQIPGQDDIGGILEKYPAVRDNVYSVYFRCLGRLSEICEQVESALGLEPLPALPKEKDT